MSNPQQSMAERFAVAIPRPMQQRVQIILQIDWTQIAERFLPLHKETFDIRDLVIAVLTKDEQLDWYIDFIKLLLTNYVWGRFSQPLKKRQFCLISASPQQWNSVTTLGQHDQRDIDCGIDTTQCGATETSTIPQHGLHVWSSWESRYSCTIESASPALEQQIQHVFRTRVKINSCGSQFHRFHCSS